MTKAKGTALAILLLLFFIGINEVALIHWSRRDTLPLAWDESIHTSLAVEYRHRLQTEGIRGVFHPAYFNYPPLFHVALSTVLDVPHDVADAGALINGIVLALLMVVIFLIGKTYIGLWEGVAAAFIFSCYPAVIDLTRPPMIDLMLTLWVALGFYTLYWSDGFSSLGWSLAFGVISGLGMLTKWSYAIYMLVPFLAVFQRSLSLGVWKKAVFAVIVAALVASPWYVENFFPMTAMLRRVTSLPPAGVAEMTGWRNALWYVFSLGEALNLYFVILLIPGIFISFWRPKLTGIFLWLVGGLLIFSLIRNHNVRYAVPVLPAAAILSVAWLPATRRWLLGVIMVGAVGFFVFQQFLPERRVTAELTGVPVVLWSNREPRAENWQHEAVIHRVQELKNKDTYARVVVLSNFPQFHSTTLNLSSEMMGVKDFSFAGPSRDRWLDFKDFILIKTGSLGPPETLGTINSAMELVNKSPDWFRKSYREVGRWLLPDNSFAILYKADPQPVKGLTADSLQLSLKTLTIGRIDFQDVVVRVTPLSPAETALGRFKELRVQASSISTKGLTFQKADLKLLKPQVNMPRFLETGEIQIISAEAFEPHLTLDGELITSYAAQKIKGLVDPRVNFENDEVKLEARYHNVPLTIVFVYQLSSDGLTLSLDRANAGFVPLPKIIFSGLTDRIISLKPNDEVPFKLLLTGLTGTGATLKVGS